MTKTYFAFVLLIAAASCASPEESALSSNVRLAFSHDPVLVNSSLTVTSLNHVLYLKGLVPTPVDRSRAEEVAKAVPGVTQVVNEIALAK